MGSDRARVSYDVHQQYRSVIMQQGRVTLEADFNEELTIAGEELRKETLDIVGSSGTPDNGYLVTPLSTPPFDISVGPGSMYVGGLRVVTPPPVPVSGKKSPLGPGIQYSQQTEWLDHSDDPDWVDINSQKPPTTEFVYLFLREQEVSAVEDSDLKDVALGGPDTAQRTRLIQHIVRLSADPTCSGGLAAAQKVWQAEGLNFVPQTMRLEPGAKLQVGFSSAASQPDPCNPQAQGGFLGADNQLIRVQISGTDKATGNPKFVWGFDDASFLYRLDLDSNNKQLLHLQSRPVDASHQPRKGQTVEVLRSAAELFNGAYVASLSGFVITLDQPYDPDTQMISLPAPLTTLPNQYYDSTQTPQTFLRVWEQEVVFTPGTAMDLGSTGVQVTLQGKVFHTGDYWLFAVRPSTPQQIYPERFLNDFQFPEGPRMWACPLAAIDWTGKTPSAQDCRNSFSSLVDLVTVEHEGKFVGVRNTLNFIGPGVTAVTDNPVANRIDIQITGGGAGESAPTLLLFPYCRVDLATAKNAPAGRDDTFIAISSTTADPFGPQQPTGAVTLYCYGTGLPSSPLQIPIPPPLSPGQMAPFSMLDKIGTTTGLKTGIFEGYVIADCAFAGAYGFARVSRGNQGFNGTQVLTDSYLAIVLPRPVQLTISSLTPSTATVVVGEAGVVFTVNLTGIASTDTDVQIAVSPAGLATIPSSVTVKSGSASATFTATGLNPGAVNITVSLQGTKPTASATLNVNALGVSQVNALAQIILSDSGTGIGTGTVDLNGPAPVNGATVKLVSSDTKILTVDPQVVVPQGAKTSKSFGITALNTGVATITATFPPGTKASKAITVKPQPTPPPPPGGGGTPVAGTPGGGTPAGGGTKGTVQ